MGNYGIKIAKENSDIQSENLKDYELWSKYPMVKVKKSGSGTQSLVVSSGSGSFSIEIDDSTLSFVPIVFATSDVYDPTIDGVISDTQIPFRTQSSTALLNCRYYFEQSSGKMYFKGDVQGGTDGTYSLDYEYIILYDKFDE